MTLYLAIDDTDIIGSRGTGRLARQIADKLSIDWDIFGVTRHQLLVHDEIPYTSHNSCAVVHLKTDDREAVDPVFKQAKEIMLDNFIEGSDPGIAVATDLQVAPALIAFAKDAKTIILTQEKARTLAKNLAVRLEGLGGSQDGVIGALAGLGLAATGNDGRFVQKGKIRDICGSCRSEDLLNVGIDAITTLDGRIITEEMIIEREFKSVKPCLVNGRSVLFVEERDGSYHAVKRD